MPWVIKKNGKGQSCVYKQGSDGQATGDALGCHASHEDAVGQMRALYASEPGAKAVKFSGESEDTIEGWGMPWGGMINGRDVQGEFFSQATNFAFDWFSERPVLYQHGLDQPGLEVVGRVKSWQVDDDMGVWVKCQLEKGSKYFTALKKLIGQQALYFSSGAMGHLAKADKSGEIKVWPWVELTLTPTPANALATLDFATAKAHLKAIDVDVPDEDALKAKLESGEFPASDVPVQQPEAKAVDLKALSGSYEALLEKLNAALNPRGPFAASSPSDRYAYLVATYPDYVIADQYEDGEKTCYRIPYSLDDEGNVTLGKATEVEQTYRPVAKAAECVPERLAEHTELVTAYAAALAERTKDLSQRRIKEGRVLSTATRRRLSDCLSAMRTAGDEIAALLDSTDPAKAEAKASLAALVAEVDLLELESALVLN